MCDYSLCGLPTRLANEGEELVVHRFRGGSMGLASPEGLRFAPNPVHAANQSFWKWIKSAFEGPPTPATVTVVCIPPGAQLVFKSIPEDLQKQWKVGEEECAFFVQTSADVFHYRDAVQFRTGLPVLLQDLREGMRVRLLSLGSANSDRERELTEAVF